MITAVSVNKRSLVYIIAFCLIAVSTWWLWPATSNEADSLPKDKQQAFKLERLDLALKTSDTLNETQLQTIRVQYGEMFTTYIENIISLCSINDPALLTNLNNFLRDPYIDSLFDDVQSNYAQTEALEKELNAALSYFYYYFPKAPRYRMLGMVGAFQYKHALTDSGLLFGLDLHLGSSYRFYPNVRFLNNYMLPKLSREYLVVDGIKLLVDDLVPSVNKEQLLEEMVRAGKVLYLTSACMPQLPDSVLLGFTAKQTQWAFENERSMWEYLISNDMIFSSDPKVISRLMSEGPFTPGLPEGSPARMAVFTGWRMVKRLMEKNPALTKQDLLAITASDLLKQSGYKGK